MGRPIKSKKPSESDGGIRRKNDHAIWPQPAPHLDQDRLEGIQRAITKSAIKTKVERIIAEWPKFACKENWHLFKGNICMKCGIEQILE
jgi:hypothetical protein